MANPGITVYAIRSCAPKVTALAADAVIGAPSITAPCARYRVRCGEPLYGAGDECRAIYVVRVGVFMSYLVAHDGGMQVTDFPMAGESVGLDGIGNGRYRNDVVALEDAEVFLLPLAHCEQWSRSSAYGNGLMLRTLAHANARCQDHLLMLGSMRAEQRVAVFLLDLSERFGRLGYSSTRFLLRMTRQDIGSYLGLSLETISRLLSRLQRDGLIQVYRRQIVLLDVSALQRLGGHPSAGPESVVDPILDRGGDLQVAGNVDGWREPH